MSAVVFSTRSYLSPRLFCQSSFLHQYFNNYYPIGSCEERRWQILLLLFKTSLLLGVSKGNGRKLFFQRGSNVAQAAQVNIPTRSVSAIWRQNFFSFFCKTFSKQVSNALELIFKLTAGPQKNRYQWFPRSSISYWCWIALSQVPQPLLVQYRWGTWLDCTGLQNILLKFVRINIFRRWVELSPAEQGGRRKKLPLWRISGD